mgnify:FL=1
MAAIERLKKKQEPTVSIALMRMKPARETLMPTNKPTNNMKVTSSEDDTSEDAREGGTHPAGTEPAPSSTLAGALQELLNRVSEYYITAHQFHWNVVGSDFAEFHDFFEEVYSDAWASLDPIAENIRKLDQMVDIEFGQPDECEGVDEMIKCLAEMNNALISKLKDAIDMADKEREQGILNFLADRLDTHQKYQWQITSFQK